MTKNFPIINSPLCHMTACEPCVKVLTYSRYRYIRRILGGSSHPSSGKGRRSRPTFVVSRRPVLVYTCGCGFNERRWRNSLYEKHQAARRAYDASRQERRCARMAKEYSSFDENLISPCPDSFYTVPQSDSDLGEDDFIFCFCKKFSPSLANTEFPIQLSHLSEQDQKRMWTMYSKFKQRVIVPEERFVGDCKPLMDFVKRSRCEFYLASLGTDFFPYLFPKRWRFLARRCNSSPSHRRILARLLGTRSGMFHTAQSFGEVVIGGYVAAHLLPQATSYLFSLLYKAEEFADEDNLPDFLRPIYNTFMGYNCCGKVLVTGRIMALFYLIYDAYNRKDKVSFALHITMLLTDPVMFSYACEVLDIATGGIGKLDTIIAKFFSGEFGVAQADPEVSEKPDVRTSREREEKKERCRVPLISKLMELFNFSCLKPFLEGLPVTFVSKCISIKDNLLYADNVVGFFTACLDYIKYFIARCKAFYNSGDWRDLLGEDALIHKDVADSIVAELTGDKRALLENGGSRLVEIKKTIRSLAARLKDKGIADHPAVKESILRAIKQLDLFDKSQNASRKEPIGIILQGPSGIGKTWMINEIAHLVKARYKMPPEADIVYYRQETKHQSIPAYHMIMAVNDYFTNNEEPSSVSTITMMQQMVDTAPVREETASLEEKKDSSINPEFVIFTTNTKRYQSTRSTCGASKLNRRYTIAEFSWTPAAVELAKTMDCTLEHLFKNLGEVKVQSMIEQLVVIRFGFMSNANDNWIELRLQKKTESSCCTPKSFLTFMLERWKLQNQAFSSAKKEDRCLHGIVKPCLLCAEETRRDLPAEGSVNEQAQGEKEALETFEESISLLSPEALRAIARKHVGMLSLMYDNNYTQIEGLGDILSADVEVKENYLRSFLPIDKIVTFNRACATVLASRFKRVKTALWLGNLLHKRSEVDDMVTKYIADKYGLPIWIQPYFVSFMFITVGIATVASLFNFVKWWNVNVEETPQGNVQAPLPQLPNVRTPLPPVSGSHVAWFASPFSTDIGNVEKYLVSVGKPGWRSKGLVVGANAVLVNAHVFRKVYPTQSVWVKPGETFEVDGFSCVFNPELISEVSKDCVLLYFPLKRALADCWEFISESTFTSPSVGYVKGKELQITFDGDSRYLYPNPGTQAGDCGNPLVISGKFVGIHSSFCEKPGKVSYGTASIVTKARIESAKSVLAARGLIVAHIEENTQLLVDYAGKVSEMSSGPNTDLKHLVRLSEETGVTSAQAFESRGEYFIAVKPTCDKPRMSCRPTSIYKAFFDKLLTTYHPPAKFHAIKVLQDDGTVTWKSPIVTRWNVLPADNFDLKPWWEHNFRRIEKLPPVALSPLSDLQALTGEPGQPYIGAVDTSKSPGPVSLMRGIPKEKVFTVRDGATYINEETLKRWSELKAKVIAGFIPLLFAKAVAKDECKSAEDVRNNKYRYFFVCEQQFNWILKSWLGPLLSHIYANRFTTGVFAGMNPGSKKEWTAFKNFFLDLGISEFDELFMDIDQKGFDVHHSIYVFCAAAHYMYHVAKKCGYSDQDARICAVLILACARYVLDIAGNLVHTSGKLLSGLYITLWFNSYVTCALFDIYAFSKGFADDYRLSSTGDDFLAGLSSLFKASFDVPDYVESMKRLGYDIQSADKGQPIRFKRLADCVFLQRTIKTVDGVVYGPLKSESIFKSLSYCVGKYTPEEQVERDHSTIQCNFGEAYLHGREFYEDFCTRVLTTTYPFSCPTYEEMDQKYHTESLILWAPPVIVDADSELPQSRSCSLKRTLTFFTWMCDFLALITYPFSRGFPPEEDLSLDDERFYVCSPPYHSRERKYRDEFEKDSYTYDLAESEEGSFHYPQATTAGGERVLPILVIPLAQNLNSHVIPEVSPDTSTFTTLAGAPVDECTLPNVKSERYNLPNPQRNFPVDYPYKMKRLLKTITISTSSITSTSFNLRDTMAISTDPLLTKLFDVVRLSRFDYKLTFSFTGNSAAQGLVRVYFLPRYNKSITPYAAVWTPTTTTGFAATCNLPHFDLDLSTSADREFCLPDCNEDDFNGADPASANGSSWIVGFLEIHPFISATGSIISDMEIRVYVEADGIDLVEYAQSGEEKWSSWLHRMSSYAAMVPTAYTSFGSKVLDIGADIAAFFGYGRSYKQGDSVVFNKNRGNWSLGTGPPDMCELVGTNSDVSSNMSYKQYPFGTPSDMSTLEAMKHWGQVAAFTLSTSPTTIEIAPNLGLDNLAIGATVNPTPLTYFAMMFKFWRGSIKIHVCLHSSPLVRGRMVVNVVPPGVGAPVVPVLDGTLPFVEFDFAGSGEVDFVIPYTPRDGQVFTLFDPAALQLDTSYLVFFLVGNLMGSVAAPSAPYISVYMAAGDDFEVAIPTTEFMDNFTIAQSGEKLFTRSQQVFGESFHSLNVLCKKPTLVYVLSQNNATQSAGALTVPMEHTGNVPTANRTRTAYTISTASWSYYAWITRCFIGTNGGFVWRGMVGPGPANSTMRTASFQTRASVGSTPSLGTAVLPGFNTGFAPSGEFIEVSFPAANASNYRPSRIANQFVGAPSVNCYSLIPAATSPATTGTTLVWLLFSCMDDTTFGGYLGPPTLTARVAT